MFSPISEQLKAIGWGRTRCGVYMFVCMLWRLEEAMVTQNRMSEPRQDEKGIPMEGKPDMGCHLMSRVSRGEAV